MATTTDEEIRNLMERTKQAYEKASIREKNWHYNICATKITVNGLLLLGCNWGVGKEEGTNKRHPYTSNIPIPDKTFSTLCKEGKKELGSFSRVPKYLKKYLHLTEEKLDEVNQSNYCFFRSPDEKSIEDEDIKLSEPLFEEYIRIINPRKILCFSHRLKTYFINSKRYKLEEPLGEKIDASNKKSFEVLKGKINLDNESIDIYFLPHPNYRAITKDARDKCWKFCFP